eukprot:TRINITY_DN16767_c0_g1_i1.p1 TRINITY_DN16767_c0_g1~~TRINITY_DN16767_c0_g1_i1.p1  ORF type:complete len:163 (-),score=6.93 TRINITY_DN16767_c0_g1_i1:295-783(-)
MLTSLLIAIHFTNSRTSNEINDYRELNATEINETLLNNNSMTFSNNSFTTLAPSVNSTSAINQMVRILKHLSLEAGYKLTAEIMLDTSVKYLYWSITSYTITRIFGCLSALLVMFYWSHAEKLYPSGFAAAFNGVLSLLTYSLGEILYVLTVSLGCSSIGKS